MRLFFLFGIILISVLFAEYDGLFFLGFNLQKELVASRSVRYYINSQIDKQAIISGVFPNQQQAFSLIYPTNYFHPPVLKEHVLNQKNATINNLTLLHTNGVKTLKLVNLLKKEFAQMGISLNSIVVEMDGSGRWGDALANKNYDIFLMGYKKEYDKNVIDFIRELYGKRGYANFMHYVNTQVDQYLVDLNHLTKKDEIVQLLKKIEFVLQQDLPLIPMYYIEKI